jgi:hypothetical protein
MLEALSVFPGAQSLGKLIERPWLYRSDTNNDHGSTSKDDVGADAGLRELPGTSWK